MILRSRRTIAALTAAAAIGAALVGTVGAGAAQAAGSANGVIAYWNEQDGHEHLINADGTGDHALGTTRMVSGWAPDGSRMVLGGNPVQTARPDDTGWMTISRSSGAENQTYDGSGRFIVSDQANQIYIQPSDGSWQPHRFFTAAQEPNGTCDYHPAYSAAGVLAFDRGNCGGGLGPVWTYNVATRAFKEVVPNGVNPVFSADGRTIAYEVLTTSGIGEQVGIVNFDGTGARIVTHDPGSAQEPSLSPDGTMLVYSAYGGPDGEAIKLLNLATGTTTVLAHGLQPFWQPLQKNHVDHVYGTGSVGNDAAASRWTFNTVGHSAPGLETAWNAVLVNKNDQADTAPALELAAEKQAPLLLTSGSSLDRSTAAELRRVMHRGWTVYLEGSTGELSNHLAAQVQALGLHVVRVDAIGSTAESVQTAKTITGVPDWVLVADSQDYRTATAAAAAAGAAGYHGRAVLLLNSGWSLPSKLKTYLNSLDANRTRMVVIGSHSIYAMEHTTLRQTWRFWTVSGTSPEALSANLAVFWWGPNYVVTLADTADWRAGVAGAAVNATYGPLLWTSSTGLDAVDQAYLLRECASVGDVQIFGGGWPTATVDAIRSSVAVDSSWTAVDQDADGVFVPSATRTRVATSSVAGSLLQR